MIKSQKMHKHFHSDSSISALIYVEPYKRESKVSIFLGGPAICLFLYAIELNFWKEPREIISGSCFSLNFRYNFSVPNEVPKVKTLHEFSLELKFSVQ